MSSPILLCIRSYVAGAHLSCASLQLHCSPFTLPKVLVIFKNSWWFSDKMVLGKDSNIIHKLKMFSTVRISWNGDAYLKMWRSRFKFHKFLIPVPTSSLPLMSEARNGSECPTWLVMMMCHIFGAQLWFFWEPIFDFVETCDFGFGCETFTVNNAESLRFSTITGHFISREKCVMKKLLFWKQINCRIQNHSILKEHVFGMILRAYRGFFLEIFDVFTYYKLNSNRC